MLGMGELGFLCQRVQAGLMDRFPQLLTNPKEFPELEAAPEEAEHDYMRDFVQSALQTLMANISGSQKQHDEHAREHPLAILDSYST